MKAVLVLSAALAVAACAFAQHKPRARDLGVPFQGKPGPLNAITDIAGVEVGQVTLISGSGAHSVRTGVTAIFPQGKAFRGTLPAAWSTLNGNGEMTGTTWIEESGGLSSPVVLTNTHSVGVAHDAVIQWFYARGGTGEYYSLPVAAETWDGFLNDINEFHVTREHVFKALDDARGGPVEEGNVGGGTGMIAHQFKAGIGTASRVLPAEAGGYTLGVLVQANYGKRDLLTIAGVPVGREITDLMPEGREDEGQGSIIVIVATDAPLPALQLKRIAKRVSLGIGIVGGRGEDSSGDIFLAFSTAKKPARTPIEGDAINPFFRATVEATEEAIVNALVAAEDMTGVNGRKVYALPHERLREILRKYGRLGEK